MENEIQDLNPNDSLDKIEQLISKFKSDYIKVNNIIKYYIKYHEKDLDFLRRHLSYNSDSQSESKSDSESKSESFIEDFVFLNKYNIIKVVFKGTISEIFLCKHKYIHTDKKLVVKRCLISSLENEINILNILKTFNNDYICNIYDNIGNYYIIYEYYSGYIDLYKFARRIKRKSIEISRNSIFIIIKQLAYIINFIHSKNILHLDIKPENILINKFTYKIKLIDFGLSSEVDPITKTIIKSFCGTKGYICPSITRNTKSIYSPEIDIFALGKVYTDLINICSDFIPSSLIDLIDQMTNPIPINRPSLKYINKKLQLII